MAELRTSKIVSALPGTLAPSTIYFVRVGAGFDLYVTNQSGTIVAYSLNAPIAGAPSSSSAVGSMVFAATTSQGTGTTINIGDTVSGSTLVVSSETPQGSPTSMSGGENGSSSSVLSVSNDSGSRIALSYPGTWRAHSRGHRAYDRLPIIAFQRIA